MKKRARERSKSPATNVPTSHIDMTTSSSPKVSSVRTPLSAISANRAAPIMAAGISHQSVSSSESNKENIAPPPPATAVASSPASATSSQVPPMKSEKSRPISSSPLQARVAPVQSRVLSTSKDIDAPLLSLSVIDTKAAASVAGSKNSVDDATTTAVVNDSVISSVIAMPSILSSPAKPPSAARSSPTPIASNNNITPIPLPSSTSLSPSSQSHQTPMKAHGSLLPSIPEESPSMASARSSSRISANDWATPNKSNNNDARPSMMAASPISPALMIRSSSNNERDNKSPGAMVVVGAVDDSDDGRPPLYSALHEHVLVWICSPDQYNCLGCRSLHQASPHYQCVQGCDYSVCAGPLGHAHMQLDEHAAANEVIPANDTSIDASLFIEPIGNDYRCIICDRVPLQPSDLPCAHIGCITCLKTTLSSGGNNNGECVTCHHHAEVSLLRVNAFITKQTSSLRLKCPHLGCPEVVILGREGCMLKEHMKDCSFAPMKCGACKWTVPRGDMERHASSSCSHRRVLCQYCNRNMPLIALKGHQSCGNHTDFIVLGTAAAISSAIAIDDEKAASNVMVHHTSDEATSSGAPRMKKARTSDDEVKQPLPPCRGMAFCPNGCMTHDSVAAAATTPVPLPSSPLPLLSPVDDASFVMVPSAAGIASLTSEAMPSNHTASSSSYSDSGRVSAANSNTSDTRLLLLRNKVTEHLEECPRAPMICKICKEAMARGSMEKHLRESSTNHIQALANQCESLHQQMIALRNENERIKEAIICDRNIAATGFLSVNFDAKEQKLFMFDSPTVEFFGFTWKLCVRIVRNQIGVYMNICSGPWLPISIMAEFSIDGAPSLTRFTRITLRKQAQPVGIVEFTTISKLREEASADALSNDNLCLLLCRFSIEDEELYDQQMKMRGEAWGPRHRSAVL